MSELRRIGDYIIIRPLGAGGMGQVYEAEETLSKRRVALKVLRDELAASEEARAQFIKEMSVLAGLDSPHIVRCLHCTEVDGQLLLALECLDGETLRARLNRAGPLPWPQVVAIAAQIAAALQVAHRQQPAIVHRDLKPENVMLLGDDHVKLLDFGIAKVVGSGQTTHTIGTLQYMSPEHIDARVLDGRADLFSLGLVMWEMLAGRVPFASDSPRELLDMLCTKPTPALPVLAPPVPPELDGLIRQLLEKSPEARPSSAQEVLGRLTSLAPDERQPTALPAAQLMPAPKQADTIALITEHERKTQRRSRTTLIVVAMAMLAAVGAAAMWLSSDEHDEPQSQSQDRSDRDRPPGPVAHEQADLAILPPEPHVAQPSDPAAHEQADRPVRPADPAPAEPTATGDVGGGDENDPTKKVCPAATADHPEPYFSDTVLIRLPKGVTGDNFVEFTPTFARLRSAVESVSCVEDVPGAMITYMAMTFFQDDETKSIATLRDETLEVMGYVAPKLSAEKRDDKIRFYQAVVDVEGTTEKPDPGRALFQMRVANGIMYAIIYECHPLAWNALKETFYASASKISFLKPY